MKSDEQTSSTASLERVATGIAGLDTILNGGLFRGGVYLIHAKPGSGKTILGSQVCFRHVAAGGRAVFVTLLTESHSRLLGQLEAFSFYDATAVGARLSYVTAYQALEQDKLKGLLGALRKIIKDQQATLMVIDGVVTAGAMAESSNETKKFVHELQVFAELFGCTTLLLTGASDAAEQYAFRTMVDGLIELQLENRGMETVRSLEITKFRGSATLLGRHLFDITSDGITVYPRTESNRGRSSERQAPSTKPGATVGIAGLDALLDGGLRIGSVTMAIGTPGVGKTSLGLSFLKGSTQNERGLYFGFFETPAQLVHKAAGIGLPISKQVRDDVLRLMWQPLHASNADALAERLLGSVKEHGIRRLFIDGIAGFRESLIYPERSAKFFSALLNELRSLGVVTLMGEEMTEFFAGVPRPHEMVSVLDNVIFLRHEEIDGRLRKRVSVAKMREGANDTTVHEFTIGKSGFDVEAYVVAPRKRPSAAKRKRTKHKQR